MKLPTGIRSFSRCVLAAALTLFGLSNTVLAVNTTTTLQVSPTIAAVGQQVILRAYISSLTAPGTVQFYVDGSPVIAPIPPANGMAQISLSFGAGNHTAYAVYSGGMYLPPGGQGPPVYYSGSTSGTVSFSVRMPSTTQLSLYPSPACSGTPFNAIVSVGPGVPTGTIQFKRNGANVGSPVTLSAGHASMAFTVTTTTGTSQSFQAVYSGNPTLMGSSSLTVNQTISAPLSILTQPVDATACLGTAATFTLTPQGIVTSYQWQESTDGISWVNVTTGTGANTATYTRTAGNDDNARQFHCVINGPCGNTTSAAATLTVQFPPRIMNLVTEIEPSEVVVSGAARAEANGHYTRTSSTRYDNDNQAAVILFFNGNWVIRTIVNEIPDEYLYEGEFGVLCSYWTAFDMDDFSNPILSPTINVCDGFQTSFTVNPSGSGFVSFQWQVSTDNGANWTDVPSGSPTFFTGTLTTADNGNLYHCVLNDFGPCGATTSQPVRVVVQLAAQIFSQPFSQLVCPGSSASFTVGATDVVAYQWRKNGVPLENDSRISGVDTDTLTINPVQVADLATAEEGYDCLVIRECEQVTTRVALGMPPFAQPQGNFTRMIMTPKNVPVNFNLLGSDNCNLPLTFEIVDQPAHGFVSGGSSASRTYTPNDPNFIGEDTFTFRVHNGALYSAPRSMIVAVVPTATLTATCRGQRILLEWDADVRWPTFVNFLPEAYTLKRATSPGGPYTVIGDFDWRVDEDPEFFNRVSLDFNVTLGTTYYYKVNFRFKDSFTQVTYQAPDSAVASATPDCPFPPPPIRPGFTNFSLIPHDDADENTGLGSLQATLPFSINFFGITRPTLWVNNNGNVTFDTYGWQFVPLAIGALGHDTIAPFWADVDTRGGRSDVVRFGTNTVDGHRAFGVNWFYVSYWSSGTNDRLNNFQLVLIERADRAAGDYDIEFNYQQIQWEAGGISDRHSGGRDGLWVGDENNQANPKGFPARAGFAAVGHAPFELRGSGQRYSSGTTYARAFLDVIPETGIPAPTSLIHNSFNTSVLGRYIFRFHNGLPMELPPP